MAFSVTTHCEWKDDSTASTYDTNSGGTVVTGAATWTPTANKLQVAIIVGRTASGDLDTPTLAGHGLTYTLKVEAKNSEKRGIFAFTALGGSPTNGSLVATMDAQSCWICVYEVDGIDTGDPTGVSGSDVDETLADTETLDVALAAFASTSNMTFAAAQCEDGATSFDIEGGYTEEFQAENNNNRVTVATKTSEDDPTFTLDLSAGDVQASALAFEIKAAAAGLTPPGSLALMGVGV